MISFLLSVFSFQFLSSAFCHLSSSCLSSKYLQSKHRLYYPYQPEGGEDEDEADEGAEDDQPGFEDGLGGAEGGGQVEAAVKEVGEEEEPGENVGVGEEVLNDYSCTSDSEAFVFKSGETDTVITGDTECGCAWTSGCTYLISRTATTGINLAGFCWVWAA